MRSSNKYSQMNADIQWRKQFHGKVVVEVVVTASVARHRERIRAAQAYALTKQRRAGK